MDGRKLTESMPLQEFVGLRCLSIFLSIFLSLSVSVFLSVCLSGLA